MKLVPLFPKDTGFGVTFLPKNKNMLTPVLRARTMLTYAVENNAVDISTFTCKGATWYYVSLQNQSVTTSGIETLDQAGIYVLENQEIWRQPVLLFFEEQCMQSFKNFVEHSTKWLDRNPDIRGKIRNNLPIDFFSKQKQLV